MASFNDKHAASIGYVNDAVVEAFEKMQIWVTQHADELDVVKHIGNLINAANRVASDSRPVATRAQSLVTSIDAIVAAMTECGVDMEGVTTAQIAQFITTIADGAGTWIEDADGVLWTPASWTYAKEQAGGVDPAVFQGIVLTNSEHEIYIASRNYGPMQFGTYGHTIPNLQATNGGPSGTPVDGEYNGRKILAGTDPEKLRRFGWAIDYFEGMKRTDLVGNNGLKVDVVFFPDQATLTSWATGLGLYEMSAIGGTMLYAIPNDPSNPTNGYYTLKYFNGSNSISFANREAIVPYTDNYGQVGCTAANACVDHREYPEDPLFWRNGSLFELLMTIMNKNDINACRAAIGQVALPSGNVLAGLQINSSSEYYFSLADGSWNNGNKNGNFYVVPVASRKSKA